MLSLPVGEGIKHVTTHASDGAEEKKMLTKKVVTKRYNKKLENLYFLPRLCTACICTNLFNSTF